MERFLFLICSLLLLFSNDSYSYPYLSSLSQHHLINAIRRKRNKGRAQSKPTHAKGIRSRLGPGQVVLILFLRADHVAVDRERAELSLQRKTKPTRFIDCVHFGARALLLEPGCPMQQRLLPKTLRRLGITSAHLLNHQ